MTSYPCNKYEKITPSYLLSVNYSMKQPDQYYFEATEMMLQARSNLLWSIMSLLGEMKLVSHDGIFLRMFIINV